MYCNIKSYHQCGGITSKSQPSMCCNIKPYHLCSGMTTKSQPLLYCNTKSYHQCGITSKSQPSMCCNIKSYHQHVISSNQTITFLQHQTYHPCVTTYHTTQFTGTLIALRPSHKDEASLLLPDASKQRRLIRFIALRHSSEDCDVLPCGTLVKAAMYCLVAL